MSFRVKFEVNIRALGWFLHMAKDSQRMGIREKDQIRAVDRGILIKMARRFKAMFPAALNRLKDS
jgi:hypothetical protein